ncbi:hypothetical protein [Streptomyces flavofungini]|uniref:Uncharacterized protein n=1 Tax=Streptomyces flavofungini TaxID=68200 RepID=A0ABS0XGL0_9ACTN|nr:hypothetical protein [Streptomyces flavofungini]MBJ3812354.1 hypothetical protein [Streptomyces flavofungini]GHC88268.1 hypothetical protein GCM10010349_75400 [Streptomyces flavofungini]
MSVMLLTGGHGCGVTVSSLALALSAPRPTLLVEAAARQASIRTGYRQGAWGGEVGLFHLAQAQLQNQLAEAFEAHLRRLDEDGNRLLLPGLTDPAQAGALAATWEPLSLLLRAMDQQAGFDVVVDAGQVVVEGGGLHRTLYPAPLAQRADLVLLVLRNTLTSVAQTLPVARLLQGELEQHGTGADALRLLVVQELSASSGGLRSDEIARRFRTPVVDLLPWDPAAGTLLTHGAHRPPRLAKMALVKQARKTVQAIGVEVNTRRRALDMPAAPGISPAEAGVLQRLAASRLPAPVPVQDPRQVMARG